MQQYKRKTKQVRVGDVWHRRLKLEAADRGLTIAKLLDELCGAHFGDQSVEETKPAQKHD